MFITILIMLIGSGSSIAAPGVQWTEHFGGIFRDFAEVFVADTAQDRFYILGSREDQLAPAHDNSQIVCWDGSGEYLWSHQEGSANAHERFYVASLTSNGGIIAIESWISPPPPMDPDTNGYRLMRFSATGDTSWIRDWIITRRDGDPDPSIPKTITPKISDGFYVCSNGTRPYMTEFNEAGDTLLSRILGYPMSFGPIEIMLVNDSAVAFCVGNPAALIQLIIPPPIFDFTWITSMPYVPGIEQEGEKIGFSSHPSGNYLYAGQYDSSPEPTGGDGWIAMTGPMGSFRWGRVIGDLGTERFTDVIPTLDGNIAATGQKDDHVWLVKFDTSGAVLWDTVYFVGGGSEGIGLAQLSDGSFVISGTAFFSDYDFFLLRTEPDVPMSLPDVDSNLPVEFALKQNYPNPFNASTQIEFNLTQTAAVELTVFDITGREVETLVESTLTAGRYTYYFHANNLPSGVYFYRLQAGVSVETKKMVLLK